MWGRLAMAEMESSQNKELRLIWEQPWASPARKHGPHPTAAGTGFCQQLSEPKGRFFPGGSRGVLSPAQPRLQSRETPSRGPPQSLHDLCPTEPRDHKKKCVLMGATKVVVICYTSRERSLKTGLGDLQRELEFPFCMSVRLFCPTLERKAAMIYLTSNRGHSGRLSWEVFSLLLRLPWWLSG